MEFQLSSLRELETVFMAWYEQRILDATALSMGEVFARSSALLHALRELLLAAHALAEASELASNKRCLKFANDVAAAVTTAVEARSICPDQDMAEPFKALLPEFRKYQANAPTASATKPPLPDLLQKLLELATLCEAAIAQFEDMVGRWKPVLTYLGDLKAELRDPIRSLYVDCPHCCLNRTLTVRLSLPVGLFYLSACLWGRSDLPNGR